MALFLYVPVQHDALGLVVQMAITNKEGAVYESLKSEQSSFMGQLDGDGEDWCNG